MTQVKRKPLVPITREFLRQFYQKYPLEPVPVDEKDGHIRRVEELAGLITKAGSKVPEQVGMPTPTRIDDCFWRNRMICEEIAHSLSKLMTALSDQSMLVAACGRCRDLLLSAERSIFAVQELNASSVKAQLKQFIPQDFRGAILERQRVSTEAKYHKQIEDLVKKGGTIRQKYDLYLQQQWERRQALVQLGECSGMYKMIIKVLAGIPQVLLDFAKEINAKLGPMEEQRIKYGPDLYGVTTLGLRLDVCLAAWAENAASAAGRDAAPQVTDVLEPAISFYVEHMLRVIRFIGDVFQHSPFFVNKDDLDAQQASAAGGGGGGMGNSNSGQDEVDLGSERATSVTSAASAAVGVAASPPLHVPPTPSQRHREADCKVSAPGGAAGGATAAPQATASAAHTEEVAATEAASKSRAAQLRIDSRPLTAASTAPATPATPPPAPGLLMCPSTQSSAPLGEVFQQEAKEFSGPGPVPPSGGKSPLVVNLTAAAPAAAAATATTPAAAAVAPPAATAPEAVAAAAEFPAAAAPVAAEGATSGSAAPSPSPEEGGVQGTAAGRTAAPTAAAPTATAAPTAAAPTATAAPTAATAATPMLPSPAIAAVATAPTASAASAAPSEAAASAVSPTVAEAVGHASTRPAPVPSPPQLQQPQPPRAPPLVHVPTPKPHDMLPGVLGSRASHNNNNNTTMGSSGGGGGRVSLTGESVASYASAEDEQPWHEPEKGYAADPLSAGVSMLLGCFGLGHSEAHEHRGGRVGGGAGAVGGASHGHGRAGHGHGGGGGAAVGAPPSDPLKPIAE